MVRNTLMPALTTIIALVGFQGHVAAERSAKTIQAAGIQGGLVVHLGCGDGKLTVALRASNSHLVHGLDTDAGQVAAARAYIRSKGLYGPVSVETFDGRHLPYTDNLVNLLVAEQLGDVTMDEVMRVLAPLGTARVGGKTIKKPWPKEIDEWTHWLHGADGNAVGNDTAVGPPRHVRWVADPRWQRHHELTPSLNAMVSCGGRLFAIINEAPAGIDGLPDRWTLVARNAFSGVLLWKRPIAEWGWKQWGDHSHGNGRWNHPTHIARRLVAVGDRVYVTLGFNAPLTALDAATGATLMTYPETRFTDEVLYHEGTLVLSVNMARQGPGNIKDKPAVKKAVVALNARTGKTLWRTEGFSGAASKADAIERVTHLTMVLGGGKAFLAEENAVTALDLRTGERIWRKPRPARPKPVTYGNYYFTNLSSLVYHDGVVFFMEPDATLQKQLWNEPTKAELLGISAASGEVLWTQPCGLWGHYTPGDILAIGGLVWVHQREAFSMMGLDPQSGEVKRRLSTKEALDQGHHHRCYRNKATSRYIITGRRGTEFIDIASGETSRNHWVRGTCRYGILPSNGLLYAPPHPCICYVTSKLNGFWALSKAESGKRKAEDVAQLERGQAYSDLGSPLSALRSPLSQDWPTYRHDAARSGHAGTEVAANLKPKWKANIGGRPSSPVIAAGKVFVASTETHTVWALDAADGKPLWHYTAGGRIDTPPTVYRGLALFGSADGWVYCLRADDGKLVWRLRAAPAESLIVCREQLESPWPVHGSVLIQNGVAYFAAGRSSFLDGGIYVQAVEPATGKRLLMKRINSLDPKTDDMAEARLPYDMPPDALGALPDILVGDGTSIFMRHLQFDPADLSYRSAAEVFRSAAEALPPRKQRRMHPYVGGHVMSVAGMLDDCWFSQTYWTVDGRSPCKLLVFDDQTAYGIKSIAGGARHSRAIFRPGTKGYSLFAARRPEHKSQWSKKVPLRAVAMVIAGKTLFLAGTPDIVIPDDPWAALDGRRGGLLQAVSTSKGEQLSQLELASPPVYDGMAAATGNLYMSLADGSVVCFTAK